MVHDSVATVFGFGVPKLKAPLHSVVSPRKGRQSPASKFISGKGSGLLLRMLRPA